METSNMWTPTRRRLVSASPAVGSWTFGQTAGVQLEYGLATNVRHANVYLSGDWGKLTVGHGSVATDGMAHADLGGASWLGGVSNWCSYASAGPACPSNDGGRMPMLRYDTPAIGAASVAVSAAENGYWDAIFKVGGSFGDAGYDLRIGHIGQHDAPQAEVAESNTTVTDKQLMGALTGDGFMYDEDGVMTGGPDGTSRFPWKRWRRTRHSTWWRSRPSAMILWNKNVGGTAAMDEDAGEVTTASAAVSFGQGTSIALSWSQDATNDHEYQYVKLDHVYGDGSIGVYYKRGEQDQMTPSTLTYNTETEMYEVATGSMVTHEGSLWGIGVGHSFGNGATAYAGFRQIQEDGMQDTDLVVIGLRVAFN